MKGLPSLSSVLVQINPAQTRLFSNATIAGGDVSAAGATGSKLDADGLAARLYRAMLLP
jgi:hypothetical protein